MAILANLTGLDYVILAILVLSTLFGIARGFVKEIISLISWVAAIYVALHYASKVDQLLRNAISDATIRHIIAVVLLIIAVLIIGAIVGKLIRMMLSLTGFGFFDRILGLIFGFARGVLVVVVILTLLSLTSMSKAEWMTSAKLPPYFSPVTSYLSAMAPNKDGVQTLSLKAQKLVAKHYATLSQHITNTTQT